VRRIIGDLSDRERVLIGLDLLYDELSEDSLLADDVLDALTPSPGEQGS
jgi:circadian clock protein KaiB